MIINGVFVDLLRHNYTLIDYPISDSGIRMASIKDIAAMKLNAVAGNGTRVKDFIDIYFMLKKHSFSDLIDFYSTKYESRNEFHMIKSLTYFNDIIVEDWPNMYLEKNLTISDIKNLFLKKRDEFLAEKLSPGSGIDYKQGKKDLK